MHRTALFLLTVLVLGPRPVAAQDPLELNASPQVQLRVQAKRYAEHIMYAATEISDGYVRPVPLEELLTAALKGLYEAAQEPMPPGLAAAVLRSVRAGTPAKFLAETREALGNPGGVQANRGVLASYRAMMRVLDPYSLVVGPEDRHGPDPSEQNYGVGLDLAPNPGVGPLIVRSVVPGGSAQRSGVRSRDRVTHIQGKPTSGMSSTLAQAALNGLPPSDVELPPIPTLPPGMPSGGNSDPDVEVTLERDGSPTPLSIRLFREHFRAESLLGVVRREDNTWDFWLDRTAKIAHVRLGRLTMGTSQDLQYLLYRLGAGDSLRGLILDLRECPGGYLDEALCCAALFLPEGTVLATVRDRSEETRVWKVGDASLEGRYLLQPTTRYRKVPLAILIDADTSGGGELIAAALKDANRAVLIGQRTRGKASVQGKEIALPIPGTTIRLTTGTFVRPGGQNLHRFPESSPADEWGVLPDRGLEMHLSPALNAQLKAWWRQQTERPGSSTRILPLDDPTADPIRSRAWKYLEKIAPKANQGGARRS